MEFVGLIINLALIVTLPVVGLICGTIAERRHYKSIHERERLWVSKPMLTCKTPLDDGPEIVDSKMAMGSVVISVDYFKRILAQFRMFFGGELGAYASLIDRAKREALLRMRTSCDGADAYLNVRLVTSTLSAGRRKTVGSVEVVAYCTAVYYSDGLRPEGA